MIASPDKENQRPLKFLQKTKLGMPASKNQVKFKQDMVLEDCKAEGVPLQSLLSNLAEDGKRWTVVADTASLVCKESRKSLQLLQGLKGTHLGCGMLIVHCGFWLVVCVAAAVILSC
ncbi:hypothetical protein SADUNF_Sadunf17G0077000 [Salix dunnii]|uniref:Uncharacterized protein n=1 Tax=Salix dunnii TaxID=1413687 RepID=A0A835J720_9ROSI|nr:hypothetical protein SADUNF_Sadunf17G0077000 [Salix dunnii]